MRGGFRQFVFFWNTLMYLANLHQSLVHPSSDDQSSPHPAPPGPSGWSCSFYSAATARHGFGQILRRWMGCRSNNSTNDNNNNTFKNIMMIKKIIIIGFGQISRRWMVCRSLSLSLLYFWWSCGLEVVMERILSFDNDYHHRCHHYHTSHDQKQVNLAFCNIFNIWQLLATFVNY